MIFSLAIIFSHDFLISSYFLTCFVFQTDINSHFSPVPCPPEQVQPHLSIHGSTARRPRPRPTAGPAPQRHRAIRIEAEGFGLRRDEVWITSKVRVP